MKIKLLMIGKTTDANLHKLIENYQKRLSHYLSFEITVIPDIKNAKNLTLDQQKEKEAELLLSKIETQEEVILLDERGKQFSSVQFSNFISDKMLYSGKNVTFVIGGAYGFSEKVYSRANSLLSISAMTFSHQMIRLLFVEQLYRAMTIIKGEPYHHE
ncbi:Ribosomal RNA large subunit methyltransferase H [uncultured Paludibacter sp.]|uniref:Ribosomal RNA large subunit methyltransferase H n=1 Tax=uncultured Paludibacter sp. TaxID=497635 RepID=A0A653AFC7_9BACT|nr:Ribosomal RNA large subunit methyltransferase H [uncultured Paludibacter sp.]